MSAPHRVPATATSPVTLTTGELDHALAFLQAVGSNDCFPEPFELAAVAHSWRHVRPVLAAFDLARYRPRAAYTMVAQKQRYEARLVHALDPMDLLLYTGLVLKVAPDLHQARRATLGAWRTFTSEFDLLDDHLTPFIRSEWGEYVARVDELCDTHGFVATADITDFYANVDLTELHSTCSAHVVDTPALRALFRLLDAWSRDSVHGLPVGPDASDFLAEIALLPVDEYLVSIGATFVRWRDDYLLFGHSAAELASMLRRLSVHLRETTGLGLNGAKTRVDATDGLVEELLCRQSTGGASLSDEQILVTGPYEGLSYEELTPQQRRVVDDIDEGDVLATALRGHCADMRPLKFLLAVLPPARRVQMVGPLLAHLPGLLPICDSVAKFLQPLDDVEARQPDAGRRLLDLATGTTPYVSPHQAMWLLAPFATSTNRKHVPRLQVLASQSSSLFVRRQALLGLRSIGHPSALVGAKHRLRDARDWEQQAILHACGILTKPEADALAGSVGCMGQAWDGENALLKAIHSL